MQRTADRTRPKPLRPLSRLTIALAIPLVVGLTPVGWDARAGTRQVDLALVLAIDTSLSISAGEHRLQLDGYASAFRDRAIFEAIADGYYGGIAVTVLEWANTDEPVQSIGWTLVDSAQSAEAFAALVEALPYYPLQGTSIGGAIGFAHQLLDEAPFEAARRVIDVSSDGISMRASLLADARRRAVEQGITINGLPICDEVPCDLPQYYQRSVIGGPAAFMVVAEGFASFGGAVRRKLVLEIAGDRLHGSVDLARN